MKSLRIRETFRFLLITLAAIMSFAFNASSELHVVALKPYTPARIGYSMSGPISAVEIVFDRPVAINSGYAILNAYIKDKCIPVRMEKSQYDKSDHTIRGALYTNYFQGWFKLSLPAGSVYEKGEPENTNELIEWHARFTDKITPPSSILEGTDRPYILPKDLEFIWSGRHLETHPYKDPNTGEAMTPYACLSEVMPTTSDFIETIINETGVHRNYPLKEYCDTNMHICTYKVDPDRISECPDTIWLSKDKQYSFKLINVLDVEQRGEYKLDWDGNTYIVFETQTEFAYPFNGTDEDESHYPPISPLKGRLYYYSDNDDGNDYIWNIFFEMSEKTASVTSHYPNGTDRKIYIHAKKADELHELRRIGYREDYNGFTLFSHDELMDFKKEFCHHYIPVGTKDSFEFDPEEEYELVCQQMEFCTLQGNFVYSDEFRFPLEIFKAASVRNNVEDKELNLPKYDVHGRIIQQFMPNQIYIQRGKKFIGK